MLSVFFVYVICVLIVFRAEDVVSLIDVIRRIMYYRTTNGPDYNECQEKWRRTGCLQWLVESRKKFGTFFTIWFSKGLYVFISDPDEIKKVLDHNLLLTKSTDYRHIKPWIGQGILTNSGERWFNKHELIAPAYGRSASNPIVKCTQTLVHNLNTVADGTTGFDISAFIDTFSLELYYELATGINQNIQEIHESNYAKAVINYNIISRQKMKLAWSPFNPLAAFSSAQNHQKRHVKVLQAETRKAIEIRRNYLTKSNIKCMKDAGLPHNELSFLDHLLLLQQEGADISDKSIREEVDTYIYKGYGSTSCALSFALYLLSKHKEIQQSAYKEALDDNELCLIESVVKEATRLYPPIPFFGRNTTEVLKIGDKTIPRGASLCIFAYAANRDPKYFSDPEKFKPNRFIDDQNSNFSGQHNIAFSGGQRKCFGQEIARFQLRHAVAMILQNFEILPVDKFEPKIEVNGIFLQSENGIEVKLRKRLL